MRWCDGKMMCRGRRSRKCFEMYSIDCDAIIKKQPRICTNETNVTNENVLICDIRFIRVNSWSFWVRYVLEYQAAIESVSPIQNNF